MDNTKKLKQDKINDDTKNFKQGEEYNRLKEFRREMIEIIFLVFLALIISFLIIKYVGQRTVVRGSSMEPTLYDGDQLIVYKFIYLYKKPQKGDIVVIKIPPEKRINRREKLYIKRVIATEGDIVAVKDRKVYLNGKPLDEPNVIKEGGSYPEFEEAEVPVGHVFVLGDNRVNSRDSRELGFIPNEYVEGKAIIRIWPLFDSDKNPYEYGTWKYILYDKLSGRGDGFGKIK